ncbi:MAG: hypothetical protein ACM30I_12460 [Gemmatimonas sp.]
MADTSAPYKFVDELWTLLDRSVAPRAEKRLAAFIRQRNVSKWIIATDFCIADQSRPHDSFAFVIFPAGDEFDATQQLLQRGPRRDLKSVKRIPSSLRRMLHKGRVFSFCFIADRKRRLFLDAKVARASIEESIAMMQRWENADGHRETIRRFRSMLTEAQKKSVSTKLLTDIIISAALIAYLVTLLCRHGKVELVGWVPDRDKITEAYGGIAVTMFSLNVSALCERQGISEPKLGIFSQTSENPWCDPYIRIADYIAGAGAAIDSSMKVNSEKILHLIMDCFADNPYLFPFKISFSHSAGPFNMSMARVLISRHRAQRRKTS